MCTDRLVVFPRQWYAQRTRSDSHTSSDVDQYQDAAEYLNLDLSSSPSCPSHLLDKPASAPTEYLNLIPGFSPFSAPNHASSLPSGGLGSADVPSAVAQDIEVLSDQDLSCDPSPDQSKSTGDNLESASEEVGVKNGGAKEESKVDEGDWLKLCACMYLPVMFVGYSSSSLSILPSCLAKPVLYAIVTT